MDVLSCPGCEPHASLSFPQLFSVHGVCLAAPQYLGHGFFWQKGWLCGKITRYEVSHLELELKKGQVRHSLEFPEGVCILAFCSRS